MLRTLLIGFGAMGHAVAMAIAGDKIIRITHVLERPERRLLLQRKLGDAVDVVSTANEIAAPIDCAVECAGHSAVKSHVPNLLRRGIDVILVSTGALSEPGVVEMLESAAAAGSARIRLVSGAVVGIDALVAAKAFGLTEVVYIGRKPPHGWKGTAAERTVNLAAIHKPVTFFEGSAREAARLYPQNANVAATVGIAGIGLDATRVRLVADPGIDRNLHSLHAEGAFGVLDTTISNRPLPDNPKTSALAAYSAVSALRNQSARLII